MVERPNPLQVLVFVSTVVVLMLLRPVLFSSALGLGKFQIMLTYYAVLFAGAYWLLRGDLWRAVWRPKNTRLWPLLPGIAVLWGVPLLAGLVFGLSQRVLPPMGVLLETLALQLFLVAAAEELFFREAAVKVFGGIRANLYLISITCFFMIHLPQGLPAAVIAAAAGTVFLALRVAGVWIVMIIGLHAASNLVFGTLLGLGLSEATVLGYALMYFILAMLFLAWVHWRFKS